MSVGNKLETKYTVDGNVMYDSIAIGEQHDSSLKNRTTI